MLHPSRRISALLAVLALSTGTALVACGGDGDDAASDAQTTTTVPETDTVPDGTEPSDPESEPGGDGDPCAAYTELTMAFNEGPDEDLDAWFAEVIVPIAAEVEATAPAEVADQLDVMLDAVASFGETGDDSVFGSTEFADAQVVVDPFVFENCTWDQQLEVVATDYAFAGLPDELEAGRAGILLVNEGDEVHEIVVARKADGTPESWDELLDLPDEELDGKVEFLGGAFAPRTGDESLAVVDLVPGEYVAFCYVPVGTASGGEVQGEGHPHLAEGMLQEFTVS